MGTITLFLIKTIFDLYIFVILLRLLLQLIQADYHNPLSQFTIKLTQLPLKPLQRFIPSYRNLDFSVVTLALIVNIIKFLLLFSLSPFTAPNAGTIVLFSFIDLIEKTVTIYFYAIIARILMSWLSPAHHSPVFFIINRLVEPVLRPIRNRVPLVGGFDLSPLIVLIVLQVFLMFIHQLAGI